MLPVFVLLYSLQLLFFFWWGFCALFYIFFLHPLLIPEHANIKMKFLQTTHFRANAYMCTQIGMRVALSRVISNSLGLSQTASRCAQLADRHFCSKTQNVHQLARVQTFTTHRTHTLARPRTSLHVSSEGQ